MSPRYKKFTQIYNIHNVFQSKESLEKNELNSLLVDEYKLLKTHIKRK